MDNLDNALQDSVTFGFSKELEVLEKRYQKLLSEFLSLADNQELTQATKQDDGVNQVLEKFDINRIQKFSAESVKNALLSTRIEAKSEITFVEREPGISIADEESITQAQEDAKVRFTWMSHDYRKSLQY